MPDRAGVLHSERHGQRNPPHQHSRRPQRRRAESKQQQRFGRGHAPRTESVQHDQQQPDHRRRLSLRHSQLQRPPFDQLGNVPVIGNGEHFGIQPDSIRIEQHRCCRQLQHQHIAANKTVLANCSEVAATNREVKHPTDGEACQQHQTDHERAMQIRPRREQHRQRDPMPRRSMP